MKLACGCSLLAPGMVSLRGGLFVVQDEARVSDAVEAAHVIEGSGLTQVGMSGLTPMSDRSDCSFYSPVAPTSPCDQGFGYEKGSS